jgi:hypothetical protein
MTAAGQRVGVMILRAWTEEPSDAIRVRITHTLDVSSDEQQSRVAASAEEVVDAVRRWLAAFSD